MQLGGRGGKVANLFYQGTGVFEMSIPDGVGWGRVPSPVPSFSVALPFFGQEDSVRHQAALLRQAPQGKQGGKTFLRPAPPPGASTIQVVEESVLKGKISRLIHPWKERAEISKKVAV